MNAFNFKTTDEQLKVSGINFSNPVVIAIEPAGTGNGFNALLVQKLANVPSAGEGSVSTGNAMLDKIKATQFERSGNSSDYFARSFQWYSDSECPEVGQVFTNDTIIVYDTISEAEVLTFNNKPEKLLRRTKETVDQPSVVKTVGGNPVYRVHLLARVADGYSHIVLKTDKAEDVAIKEIQRSAAKIS